MKFLIIGLGSMGKRRVRNLQALKTGEIIGADTREDRRKEAAEKYGITTFATAEEAFDQKPDATIVSLPPDLHTKFAQMSADRGIPFFAEASVTDGGLKELMATVKAKNLVAFPSCTMRYFPGPKRIKELVKSGAIGKPLAWQYQAGQYLPDWHPWESITEFYVGKRETGGCREIVPFELVWLADIFGAFSEVEAHRAKVSDLPVDIDDIYMLQTRHESGVLGQLTIDVLGRYSIRDIRITGSQGTIEWDDSRKEIRVFKAGAADWEVESLGAGTVEAQYINPEEPYIEEMRTFINCVTTKTQPGFTLADDHKILNVLYSAEKSSDSKSTVAIS